MEYEKSIPQEHMGILTTQWTTHCVVEKTQLHGLCGPDNTLCRGKKHNVRSRTTQSEYGKLGFLRLGFGFLELDPDPVRKEGYRLHALPPLRVPSILTVPEQVGVIEQVNDAVHAFPVQAHGDYGFHLIQSVDEGRVTIPVIYTTLSGEYNSTIVYHLPVGV